MLRAQRNNQLLVRLLFASLVEDTHVRLSAIEGFASFTETASETVVDESDLEDALQSFEDGHLALAGGCIATDFDFVGRSHGGLGFLFSVRLVRLLVWAVKLWR